MEAYQKTEEFIGKKLELYPTEEDQVLVLLGSNAPRIYPIREYLHLLYFKTALEKLSDMQP